MSIVFDRAVDFYDRTRAMPPEVAARPIEMLIRETNLPAEARVLEIGIGTGRMAIPLAERIRRVTGVDLSRPMMEALVQKIAGTPLQIDVAEADVVRLPFPDTCFDLIYAVHVLHLVNGWRSAVEEARRVLKPGGYLLISWHRRMPDSPNSLLRKELGRRVASYGVSTKRPGAQSEEDILAELTKWQGQVRSFDVLDWSEATTIAQILDELDRQIFSETWMIPRPVLDEVMPGLRAWAQEKFGDLDQVIEVPSNFRWLIARR